MRLVNAAHVNELAAKCAQHLLHNRMLLGVLAQAILYQALFIFPRQWRIVYGGRLILDHDPHTQLLAGNILTNFAQHFDAVALDRKSTRLNSSHGYISYAVFCLKKKKKKKKKIKYYHENI